MKTHLMGCASVSLATRTSRVPRICEALLKKRCSDIGSERSCICRKNNLRRPKITSHLPCALVPWLGLPLARSGSGLFPSISLHGSFSLSTPDEDEESRGLEGVSGPREWHIEYPGAEFQPAADNSQPAPDEPCKGSPCICTAS